MAIPIHCAHTTCVNPADLQPNPLNPNQHSAHQIQLLASIIKDQGWRNPITVSKRSGLIVRGHGRHEAAMLMGATEVPIDEQDYASDADELADLLADNRLAELSELDEDGLKNIIAKIMEDGDFDIEMTGFMEDEVRKMLDGDDDLEEQVETIEKMEVQAFEHHDYLVFMFHDLRDWMQALQMIGVKEVDYSITRKTRKIGLGRVIDGKRLLRIMSAAMARTQASENEAGDTESGQKQVDDEPQAVSDSEPAGS